MDWFIWKQIRNETIFVLKLIYFVLLDKIIFVVLWTDAKRLALNWLLDSKYNFVEENTKLGEKTSGSAISPMSCRYFLLWCILATWHLYSFHPWVQGFFKTWMFWWIVQYTWRSQRRKSEAWFWQNCFHSLTVTTWFLWGVHSAKQQLVRIWTSNSTHSPAFLGGSAVETNAWGQALRKGRVCEKSGPETILDYWITKSLAQHQIPERQM